MVSEREVKKREKAMEEGVGDDGGK